MSSDMTLRLEQATDRTLGHRDVVMAFSFVTWDGVHERGMNFAQDRLLARLMADERLERVLVANSYRSAPRRIARRLAGRDRPFPADAKTSLYSPLRLRRRDPSGLGAIARA